MQSVTDRYTKSRTPSPTHCEPKPEECSTCGMLECLCRPRFFAGQVLTADDLNRLEHYVIGKNRLHNRQLHGWGVVNGLEVTCDECGKGVVVSCGYALSPCGDDIVVCDPVTVDVCKLITACRQIECRQPCDPPRQLMPGGCDENESEWILCIRYSESPTRGIKPLLREPATCCGAGTKAKSECGCGCGGNGNGRCNCQSGSATAKPRTAPVQCEPTIVCEGFSFDVYRKPPDPPPGDNDKRIQLNPDSELFKRFDCCAELLLRRIPKMPGQFNANNVQQNLPAWQQWMCTFKDYLDYYLSNKPGYNCALLARLRTIVCPPANNTNAALVFQTIVLLFLVWLDAVLACFCSALLPPCPDASLNDCVPLATVRVSGQTCKVLSICNWTIQRKFAVNFPALQYWLSILPFGVELRRILDIVCCLQIEIPETRGDEANVPPVRGVAKATHGVAASHPASHATGDTTAGTAYEKASSRLNPHASHPDRLKAAARLATETFARGKTSFDPQTFIESAFLSEQDKGKQHLSATDLDNLPQFLILNQLLRPIASDSLSSNAIGAALGNLGVGFLGAAAQPRPSADVDAVRKEVESLRADVERQARLIEQLRKRPGAKGKP